MSEIEQVVGLQDEIHNLKKHKDALFEKIEKRENPDDWKQSDIYEEKKKILALMDKLSAKLKRADLLFINANPQQDQGPEAVETLKSEIKVLEEKRTRLASKANATLKGLQ